MGTCRMTWPVGLLATLLLLLEGVEQARADFMFTAHLTGSQETPPNASGGNGDGVFVLNAAETELTFHIKYAVTPPTTVAHFHNGPSGVAGPVVRGFIAGTEWTPGPTGNFIDGVWGQTAADSPMKLTPFLVSELFAGNIYANIHSTTFPGGEIRGQLVYQPAAVPEPGTLTLAVLGAVGLLGYGWRRRKQTAS